MSCSVNTYTFDEGILDAQVPRNAKGDACASLSHFVVAVRQKTLARNGLASFGAEPRHPGGHRPHGYAPAGAAHLCIQNRPIKCIGIYGTGH